MDEKERLTAAIEQLKKQKRILEHDLIQLDDEILYQNFGLYKPQYDFADLDNYKDKLNEIRKNKKKWF